MFYPDHKTIRGHPLHITVQLNFIPDLQTSLTIENKMSCGRQVGIWHKYGQLPTVHPYKGNDVVISPTNPVLTGMK
jgi:hypothetical protein